MAEYRYLGKNQPRLAARDIVTGRAKYAADERIAGMQIGRASCRERV